MNDPKTTCTAIFGAMVMTALVGALIMHKIDTPTFGAAAGTIATFLGVLIGVFASDGKGTPPAAPLA